MKKTIYLIIGILVIAVLVVFAIKMTNGSKVTPATSLIDFSIDDTASVTKIVVYNSFNNKKYTVTREKGKKWEGPNHACVQQSIPKMMLTTFKDVTLKGYVPKTAMANMKRVLMAQYKKVDIYKGDELVKTWYVGHATQDHLGTYMLLETPDVKSDNPVIMGMKGFYGILKPRFVADSRKYECTDLFSYQPEDIQAIRVINRIHPSLSYSIKRDGLNNFDLSSNGKPVMNYNKDNLVFYLNGFKNVHYYGPNYVLSKKQIDSIKQLPAEIELKIKGKKDSYDLKLYRRLKENVEQPKDSTIYDLNLLWGIKNDGELVEMQYYGIGPLIQGLSIFGNQKNTIKN